MATATLDFERPLAELEKQIDELKRLAGDQQLNVTEEIAPLEKKLTELREEIYKNLTPLQRAMLLLLRQKNVFQLRHGGRLELVKTRQSLRDCRSINRIDVELRSICFGDEITIL